ncbi:MAG: SDR family oxidoreductase [Phycisphaerae bacterium]|nr:SDR family oxidoreductase [Phycisphaerae bacterium]
MFSLKDKIAAVTGAGSGIGEAIAHVLSQAGAMVYVLEKDQPRGQQVAEEIRNTGALAQFIHTDVADEASCNAAADSILKAHGRCDVLVNNAGIGHVGTALTTTPDDLDRLYAVNVKGVLQMSRPIIRSMIARRSGSIINMASVGGVVAIRDRLAYCITKFAVVGLTKCMALDHAESQVRVNCICPGRVETPFVQARIREYPDPEKAYREMAASQALGRMGKPEEIAAAALYLASDEAAFVTGSCLLIDGGLSVGK